MSSMEVSNLTKEKLREMFSVGKRFDSRSLLDYRNIELSYGVSNKAEGSARLKLGKTEVVAGVKLQVGEPYPDSLDKGNLMVSGDLLPLASPRFESGPPGFDSIELPRLVDRVIRASELIDFSKLVIQRGEKVWTVIIDIYPINDDGNLIDASTICAVAALKDAVFPEIDEEGRIDYEKKTKKKLPLADNILPFSISFFKFGNSIILDPTREEEEACDTRITFGISKWSSQYVLNSCQKRGESPLSREEVEGISSMLPKKYEELNKRLNKMFK